MDTFKNVLLLRIRLCFSFSLVLLLLNSVTAQPESYLNFMHSKLDYLCSPSLKTMQFPFFADCGALLLSL